jgi:predicted glycosyltransferase
LIDESTYFSFVTVLCRAARGNPMKRVLIYSHDTFGLGNIRRMLEVTRHLVQASPDVSVLIVTGSPLLHAFRVPARVDYLKLPCLSRDVKGRYGARSLPLDLAQTVRLRANLLTSAIVDFAPDLLLIDKKPFGVEDELAGALEALSRSEKRPRMVLLLRDILDSPEATVRVWSKNAYYEAIENYYDEVLVVGDPDIFDLKHEYAFPPFAAAKIRYCGYIAREPARRTRAQVRAELGVAGHEPMLLITPGGGEDGHRLVTTALDGLSSLPPSLRPRTHVVCGPEMAAHERETVEERVRGLPGMSMQVFCDDMMALMGAADVALTMGGYNTVCEVLSSSGCAVIVPRTVPSLEQAIRADRLACLGRVDVLHSHALTPDRLMQVALQALARGKIHAHGPSVPAMDGLERVTRHLSTALGLEPRSDARARSRRAAAAHPSMHAGRQALR